MWSSSENESVLRAWLADWATAKGVSAPRIVIGDGAIPVGADGVVSLGWRWLASVDGWLAGGTLPSWAQQELARAAWWATAPTTGPWVLRAGAIQALSALDAGGEAGPLGEPLRQAGAAVALDVLRDEACARAHWTAFTGIERPYHLHMWLDGPFVEGVLADRTERQQTARLVAGAGSLEVQLAERIGEATTQSLLEVQSFSAVMSDPAWRPTFEALLAQREFDLAVGMGMRWAGHTPAEKAEATDTQDDAEREAWAVVATSQPLKLLTEGLEKTEAAVMPKGGDAEELRGQERPEVRAVGAAMAYNLLKTVPPEVLRGAWQRIGERWGGTEIGYAGDGRAYGESAELERVERQWRNGADSANVPLTHIADVLVNQARSTWAESVQGLGATLVQDAVNRLFDTTAHVPARPGIQQGVRDDAHVRQVFDALVKAQYDATQKHLKDRGVTELLLMRGVTRNGFMRETGLEATDAEGWKQTPTTPIPTTQNALSSWATDAADASAFTTGGTADAKARTRAGVLIARVPADRVFAIPATGIASLMEHEVIVVGPSVSAVAVPMRPYEELPLDALEQWLKDPDRQRAARKALKFAADDQPSLDLTVGMGKRWEGHIKEEAGTGRTVARLPKWRHATKLDSISTTDRVTQLRLAEWGVPRPSGFMPRLVPSVEFEAHMTPTERAAAAAVTSQLYDMYGELRSRPSQTIALSRMAPVLAPGIKMEHPDWLATDAALAEDSGVTAQALIAEHVLHWTAQRISDEFERAGIGRADINLIVQQAEGTKDNDKAYGVFWAEADAISIHPRVAGALVARYLRPGDEDWRGTDPDHGVKTLVHEMLHAKSAQFQPDVSESTATPERKAALWAEAVRKSRAAYKTDAFVEEALVESMAQQISERVLGRPTATSTNTYRSFVSNLQTLVAPEEEPGLLFHTPPAQRATLLAARVDARLRKNLAAIDGSFGGADKVPYLVRALRGKVEEVWAKSRGHAAIALGTEEFMMLVGDRPWSARKERVGDWLDKVHAVLSSPTFATVG